MSQWKKVKLGELYEVHNGLSKGRKFFGKGFPFLSFTTVFNNFFLPDKLDSWVLSTEKERKACSIRRGDVFITRTSETMDELGMSCVALKDYPNATYNGFTKRLRPLNEKVVPGFIGYYLRSPQFRGKFMAFSTMTTRASLANDQLLSMEIELPDNATQSKIANILFKYDSLIGNYQQQIKLLEEAAQRLYKEWFVGLHFSGYENTKIVNGVPEGWEKETLGNIVPILTGKKDANFADVKGKYPFFTCAQDILNAPSYSFDGSAVLLAGNGDFNIKLYRGKFEAYQRTYVLIPKELKYLFLIYNAIATNLDRLSSRAAGSTIKFLTKGMISSIPILIPSALVLKEYNCLSEEIQNKIELLRLQLRLLTEARDRLLPKLMSGEIEV